MSIVAAVQMASGPNVQANLLEAGRLIGMAAKAGAALVVLPENFALMPQHDGRLLEAAEADGQGPLQEFLSRQAARHEVWLVGGTIPLQGAQPSRVRAACLVYDAKGRRVARYDKLHMFDVTVLGTDESYNESATFEPGNELVVIDSPVGRLGLAVCYDLRFPELFRSLLDQGVEVIALPAAFTAVTGKAHWEPLLRARAIENLCYVVAAAQGGYHASGRETHGDSMVVDPWGTIVDRLRRGSGVVTGEVDLRRMAGARGQFPAIAHRRLVCRIG